MKSLLSLTKYLSNYKNYLIIGLVFILFSNVFAILIPPIVRESIDGVLLFLDEGKMPKYHNIIPYYFQSKFGIAILSGGLILLSAFLKGICMYFMRMTIIVMSRYIEFDQKNDIFKHYQSLGQDFYAKNYTGDLMNRISDDVSKVRMFTGPAIMYTLNLTCMIIMVVSLMFYINSTITLYVLIPFPILALSIYFVSDAMNKRSDLIQQRLSKITSFVQETFSGVQLVKSYAAESYFIREFRAFNINYKKDNMSLVRVNGIFMPAVLALIGMSILITVYVGGNAVIANQFTLGNIVEYIIYVNMLTWPVTSIGYVTSLVQRASASQNRIDEFMNTTSMKNKGDLKIENLSSNIEFRDVWFRYDESSEWVLKSLNFVINSQNKIGILGTTGAGKSTIAKLLMGIYAPSKGSILIDGIPIQDYCKTSLSSIYGYVSQDIFLFSDSIKNNILMGCNSKQDYSNLDSVIKCAELQKEINSFPDKIETVLGERGITLSGGQKQRVSIARALIKKPSVLIIDNGMSAVDTKTEASLKQNINSWSESNTAVYISHRISTVQDCDSIILLDEGEIVEIGAHQKLINSNDIYSKLFSKQLAVDDNS
ncbi:ABC transporter ATP-binding protein/permease [Bacteroidia bacterium]|nr:ABC transporter ATP-binding protein/permease [Bacteroidia bacterium]